MRRAWKWRIAAVVVAGVAVLVLWPRAPRLEPYTTPSLVLGGDTIQITALVPAGWTADDVAYYTTDWREALQESPEADLAVVSVRPRGTVSRWTAWLNQLLGRIHEVNSDICLSVSTRPRLAFRGTQVLNQPSPAPVYAKRQLLAPLEALIVYERDDRRAFDATCRQICESFRVISEK